MKRAVDGLILRETPVGENDKLLTVLTASEGRILMTAKGARSLHSKVMPICRLFTYANLEYYEKQERRWLSGGSVNDSFFGLHSDIEGFALAAYIAQVAAEITGEGLEADEILRMTLNTLYCIEKKQKPYAQIKGVYEWFAASVSGFAPDLRQCGGCGCAEHRIMWLDVMNGNLLCDDCFRKRTGNRELPETDLYRARNILLPLEPSVLASLRYCLTAPLSRQFAFSLHAEEDLRMFERVTEQYLLNHLERGFDTLTFYRSVQQAT